MTQVNEVLDSCYHSNTCNYCTWGLFCLGQTRKDNSTHVNTNLMKWPTFWDSYESAIHTYTNLSDVNMFNYLRLLLNIPPMIVSLVSHCLLPIIKRQLKF